MELLKQPLCHPLSLSEKVITLYLANQGYFDSVEKSKIKEYQMNLLQEFDLHAPEICKEIEEQKELTDELMKKITETAESYRQQNP